MVNRSDIGRRVRAKALKKVQEKQKKESVGYENKISEESLLLRLEYDYKMKTLPDFKIKEYFELKKKLRGDKQ